MLLSDWLINTSLILDPSKPIVLNIVNQLNEKYTNSGVGELKGN
jgi:hypothetical protein